MVMMGGDAADKVIQALAKVVDWSATYVCWFCCCSRFFDDYHFAGSDKRSVLVRISEVMPRFTLDFAMQRAKQIVYLMQI